MSIELLKSVHCVGEANLHLQFTPAFRQDVFADVLIRILMRDYMLYQAKRKGFTISALGFGDDHFHVFVTQWKNFSPAKLAQLLKGFTARQMRKHHRELFGNKLWGNKFWTGGYFYRTVGAVNAETVCCVLKTMSSMSLKNPLCAGIVKRSTAAMQKSANNVVSALTFQTWRM